MDGEYSSRVFDAIGGGTLILKNGDAFINAPDDRLLEYGKLSKQFGEWRLYETGVTNEWWIIERNAFGLELSISTNRNIRYSFTKQILPALFK